MGLPRQYKIDMLSVATTALLALRLPKVSSLFPRYQNRFSSIARLRRRDKVKNPPALQADMHQIACTEEQLVR
jgi:hypothetical protein